MKRQLTLSQYRAVDLTLLAVILAITLIPGIYSYCLYRKKQKGDKS